VFRPNCRAVFRLIFEQAEFTIDNAFNLRDLILQELVKIIVVCYTKLMIKIKKNAIISVTLAVKCNMKQKGRILMGTHVLKFSLRGC